MPHKKTAPTLLDNFKTSHHLFIIMDSHSPYPPFNQANAKKKCNNNNNNKQNKTKQENQ